MSVLPPLRIKVRLFAMQRETAGTRELRLEMPLGSTVDDAWAAVVEVVPALAPGRKSLRFAVNGDYSAPDRQLADGDEIACIPPVSGGSGDLGDAGHADNASGHADGDTDPRPDERRRILELREEPFGAGLAAELADRLATDEDGGVVAFLGRTRATPGTPAPGQEDEAQRHAGRDVQALAYEAFEPMALAVLEEIADEIEARFGVRRLAIVHRTGEVPLGDTSVVVVAVAPHRDAAFAAARHAIDETKARAPIWKAERFTDGHVWIGHVARTGPAGEDA
ncbi:MAG: molybdenum cofactor biosynthesis protein MoaE [Chloroflexi bacterium]|nr:molybdenum cofactor biosynthesis protein MoaE [Chloroflexota bacterium]